MVFDVTVLLATFRQDHAHHPFVRPWFDETFTAGADVIVPDFVWVGFLRIVTNTHVFEVPSTLDEASEFMSAVTTSSAYRSVAGLPAGLDVFLETCREGDARGNLVPDAYIASVARSYACPVVTLDKDFRRFDKLQIIEPKLA
jgi:toxin-antitoxin system PIN domain toxin